VEVKTAVKAMPVTDVLCRGFETEQGFKKSKKKFVKMFFLIFFNKLRKADLLKS